MSSTMNRISEKQRETAETQIRLALNLDGGESSAETGVGFLDHMLDLLARHGRLGLKVEANGDLETGAHHTVEDVGIVLGQALDEALGDRAGIRRCRRPRSPASTPSSPRSSSAPSPTAPSSPCTSRSATAPTPTT
jgi:imidazoleglycerol phosphate dehydratase HisB